MGEPAATPTTPPRPCGTQEATKRSSRRSKSSERSTWNTFLCMEPETRGASQVHMRLHQLTNSVMGLRTVEHLCAFHAQQRLTRKVTLRIAAQPQTWILTWSRPSSSRQPASIEQVPSVSLSRHGVRVTRTRSLHCESSWSPGFPPLGCFEYPRR